VKKAIGVQLLVIALLAAPPPGAARPSGSPGTGHGSKQNDRGGISLSQAVEQVRRDTGGRVLSADTLSEGGGRIHRIKVLTPDRRVRVIRIRAGGR
jgi:hypothetical protein